MHYLTFFSKCSFKGFLYIHSAVAIYLLIMHTISGSRILNGLKKEGIEVWTRKNIASGLVMHTVRSSSGAVWASIEPS